MAESRPPHEFLAALHLPLSAAANDLALGSASGMGKGRVVRKVLATIQVRGLWLLLLGAIVSALGTGCAIGHRSRPSEPPPMRLQPADPVPIAGRADTVPLKVGAIEVALLLPEGWRHVPDRLAVHFHTSASFALGEHLRAGYRFPLVAVMLGSGSARYRAPFVDPTLFPELVSRVENELRLRTGSRVRVRQVDVSSFSAGYGAVRELVQQPAARTLIRRIVLSDSLYAGLVSGADGKGPRVVQPDQIECWVPFARDAIAGRTTFVLTHSQIPTPTYASTAECAEALIAAVGLERRAVARVLDEWPLETRCDAGRFHVWGYAGADANAHLVHPRSLAEVWRALDAAGRPPRQAPPGSTD